MPLLEEAQKAARLLREHDYVRLVAREDGDAICAATLLGHALRRGGIDFHVTWTPRMTRGLAALLAEEENELLVLVGLGGDADEAPTATKRLVLDQDPAPVESAVVLSADDASLGAIAHVLSVALSPRNEDLALLALAGATSARRHVGGLTGLDAALADDAARSGILARDVALGLRGGDLLAALSSLDEPAIQGVTGRARNVKKLLADLGLMGDAPLSLPAEDAERLGSLLAARLLQQDASDAALDALFRPRLRALRGPHTGMDAVDLGWLAEAAASLGRGGLAFAALWPDEAASAELAEAASGVREECVAALLKAEREMRREGRLAIADAPRAGLAAPLADRVALALLPAGGVAVARAMDGDATLLALRSFGRDVARPAQAAARACGGLASGARSAARVRVPPSEEGRFVKTLAEGLA